MKTTDNPFMFTMLALALIFGFGIGLVSDITIEKLSEDSKVQTCLDLAVDHSVLPELPSVRSTRKVLTAAEQTQECYALEEKN